MGTLKFPEGAGGRLASAMSSFLAHHDLVKGFVMTW